jgi:cell division protein FtsW
MESLRQGRAFEKPPWDVPLLVALLTLAAIGIVMVYSSSAVYAGARLGDGAFYLKRQVGFAIAGIFAMALTMRIGYRRLGALAYPILAVAALGVILTFIPGLGVRAGGAQRWIRLAGVQLQPSEFAKIALCLYLARSVAQKGDQLKDFRIGFLPHALVFGAFGALVLAQPDFGTMMVLTTTMLAVLFVAGARLTYVFVAIGAAVPMAYLLVVTSEYRMRRVMAFLDPFSDRFGIGYQPAEALMSVASGGVFGLGLGEGRQKLGFLPAGHTDYILASIGEELGLVGVGIVLVLFGVIFWRGMRIAQRASEPFGTYLAFGVTTLLALETLINAGMCLSLLPSKGVALPLLSYGGTAIIKAMIAGGLLLSVSTGGGGFLTPAQGATRCT